jgi:serine/threonine-protein kinase
MNDVELNGSILGNRYRLLHQVGIGGTALVYEAYDQLLERPVAIKLLQESYARDVSFQERFRQEAKAAANLSHPNIVTIFDFGVDPLGLYIIMEFLPGKDLKTKIKEYGRYSETTAIPLMIQACSGLGYAHRAGIVHCDIKPHNLLITRDQRLKITDFGIARALSSINADEKNDVIWGSPLYFSPEQTLGEAPSPASDVYSFGVVMYEMLTGRLPFEAATTDELIQMHQTQPPPDPREINPEISEKMAEVINKILAKEPSARYRTADQLGRVLHLLQTKPETTITEPPTLPHVIQNQRQPDRDGEPSEPSPAAQFDWKMIGLELLAFLLVGGLIPFWLFIILRISALLR